MNRKIYNEYVTILESELVPALGCTEPIALAYAAAKAKEVLGKMPDHITMRCSGNIIKNVKGVKVPNSGGMKGVEAAAVLGITGGDPSQALEVLEHVTDREIDEAEKLLKAGFCDCVLKDDVANLYIEAYAVCKKTEKSEALVVIEDEHTNITHIEKDGQVLFHKEKKEYCQEREKTPDKSLLNLEDIITFANEVQITDVEKVLGRQIKYNTRIAEEGLRNPWGAQVGRVVLEEFGEDVKWRAVAKASAGSDARMSGCALPVIINSGSGNQGMISALLCFIYIVKKFPILHLTKSDRKISFQSFGRLLSLGIPMGLQFSITAIGTIIVQGAVNVYGETYMAGFSAAGKLQNMIMTVFVAFGATVATYVGQNRGAGRMDRVKSGVRCTQVMILVWSVIAMAAVCFGGKYMTWLFIDPSETEVVNVSVLYFRTVFWCYPFLGSIFLYRNTLQGMGYGLVPMLGGVFELAARSAIVMAAAGRTTFQGVCLADPAAWIAALIPLVPYYFYTMRKWKTTETKIQKQI